MPIEIVSYLQEMNRKCQAKCSTNTDGFAKPNFLECPRIVDNIMLLFSQFPAWTNVMHTYYPTAKDASSSTGSEGYNRIMKNIYNMSRPVSANRFILNHLNFIASEILIGRAAIKTVLKTKSKVEVEMEKSTEKFDSSIKIDQVRQKPERVNCNQLSDKNVIVNGIKLLPVNIRNREYNFIYTCPFDSIAELLIAAYKTFEIFKQNVDHFLTRNKSDFFDLVKSHSSTEDSLKLLYVKRAEIMLLFSKVEGNIVNCEMNVTSLFEKLTKSFSDILGLVSCNKCGSSRTLRYQTKILQGFDISSCCDTWSNLLTSAVSQQNTNCRRCLHTTANLKYKVGSYIAFDVEYEFENASKNIIAGSANNVTKCVEHLPIQLEIENKLYGLLGVISFVPVDKREKSHYVAYVRKPTFWKERNDLTNKEGPRSAGPGFS